MRFATLALAFVGSASAITMYERDILKYDGATYSLNRVNQLGVVGDQISAGGHWEASKAVTDTKFLTAGCYEITTTIEDGDNMYNLTLVQDNKTIVQTDNTPQSYEFSVGQAFCDLNPRDYGKCFTKRSRNLPAMTCRNYQTVLLTDCNMTTADAAYTNIYAQCKDAPIFPITLTLIIKPNLNDTDMALFEEQLAAALGQLLDIYPDAITGVTVTHHTGFDVVDVQISAFLQEELDAILAILATKGSLDSLTTSVDALKGTTIVDMEAVQGANAPVPSDLQSQIDALDTGSATSSTDSSAAADDDLAALCKDGSEPSADGTCADGSTPSVKNNKNGTTKSGSSSGGSSGLSGGAIAGIAIGCIVGAAVIVGGGAHLAKKRRRAKAAKAMPPVASQV